jgi:putative aldouronate transport system permease protein
MKKRDGAVSASFSYIWKYQHLYVLLLPALLYYVVFKYLPMYGIIIAFQDFKPARGVLGSAWVGWENFDRLLHSRNFPIVFRNTLLIGFYKLVFYFPVPLLLALLLNEVDNRIFKKTVQTIVYLPHFISWVVLAGLIYRLTSIDGGIINVLIKQWGGEPIVFLANKTYFRGLLVISEVWKSAGWGTLIYLAAISTVNPEMYESAVIDGANRFRQTVSITLPSIIEVVTVLLVLFVGNVLRTGFMQIISLYNPTVYEVADVFQTYVYRTGLLEGDFSYATAVGLFNGIVALALVVATNSAAKLMGSEGMF